MKRGDIVLIKYPFTDFSTLKVRPALVISSDEFNKQGEDAVFMCISATPREPKKSDIKIESSNPEFAQTGLRRDSVFRVAKVVILKKSLAISKIGEVGPNTMSKIDAELSDVLGFSKN